jgi:hypothetical protein
VTSGPVPFEFIATQLGYQAPFLLAYLIGMLLAVMNLRRARRAAVLALVALVVLFVVTFAATVIQEILFQSAVSGGANPQLMLTVVGFAGGC